MRRGLLAAAAMLGAMLMLAGCSTSQPEEQQMGTVEEYQNYGMWNDPYAYNYGYGYDPYSPFWYSPYPYYYPYYAYPPPYYYGPAPAPPPRPRPPIQPRHGHGGRHPLVSSNDEPSSPPTVLRQPEFHAPMRTAPVRVR